MIHPDTERRILQGVVACACSVPILSGAMGVLNGPAWLHGGLALPQLPHDLDSHFRYMSGIFFALGLWFVTCVPAIEQKGARFRMLGSMVIIGGLARAFSVTQIGWPGHGHIFGLCMELGVVPLLLLWQAGFARRYNAISI